MSYHESGCVDCGRGGRLHGLYGLCDRCDPPSDHDPDAADDGECCCVMCREDE